MPSFSIPLSGLTADSAALSTIANNLANQNTTGYKSVRVLFSDLFYQSMGTTGAGNPIQQGAGTQVSAMPTTFTQGSVNSTGVSTDVAIQGDGFFVIQKDGVVSYTRDGSFTVDKNNYLVTLDGQQVMGYPAVNGVVDTGQGLTPIQLGAGTVSPATPTTNLQLTTNLDATAEVGDTFSTPITVYDSLGASHVLTYNFTKTGSNAWSYSITIPAADVGATGDPVEVGAGTMTFDSSGNLLTPAADVTGIAVTGLADGAADISYTWQLYNNGASTLTQVAASSSTASTTQNGSSSGTLVSFSIGADGVITGSFTNGRTAAVGQLPLATFANNQGLTRVGDTNYSPTLASGQAVVGAANTGGRGSLSGGALELSNVDIASEFANLIVAQRAFEANAKAVTTFDEITQATINLKR